MRIIAGKYRRRLISYPDDASKIRPTKDRVREALFSALGNIENKAFLDLYAGSGSMGLEALSRGCEKVYFVDNYSLAIRTVKNNLASLNIPNDQYEVMFMNDKEALKKLSERSLSFDLIYIDPPYKSENYMEIINLILSYSLLNNGGRLILESDKQINMPLDLFSKNNQYKYGDIFVTVLWR